MQSHSLRKIICDMHLYHLRLSTIFKHGDHVAILVCLHQICVHSLLTGHSQIYNVIRLICKWLHDRLKAILASEIWYDLHCQDSECRLKMQAISASSSASKLISMLRCGVQKHPNFRLLHLEIVLTGST